MLDENDKKVITECAAALRQIGQDDDVERIKEYVNSLPYDDKLEAACQIAISFMRCMDGALAELKSIRELADEVSEGRI